MAVASLIKDIKLSSNQFILKEGILPKFKGWQDGYGAFTESIKNKNSLVLYIKNQEEHHQKGSFKKEYMALLQDYEIEFDPKYLL